MDSHNPHDSQQHIVENEHFNSTMNFQPPLELKHSRLGMASFIISLVSLLGYITVVAIAGSLIAPYLDPNGNGFNGSPSREMVTSLTTLAIIAMLFILSNLIGAVLGIIGVILKNRKKVLSILGLIMNSVILVIILAFFIISVIFATSTT